MFAAWMKDMQLTAFIYFSYFNGHYCFWI